ncbi:MAG TPA: HlyD family efflux transporter periplasmic adaptor subunit, partial [Bacteroidales bacterium]|nr:HlyD family efflux transporter periplasmic adaptor subunit [Bacteroidales bacterium]
VCEIADLSQLTLRAYVSALQLSNIAIGQQVQVFYDESAGKLSSLTGIISWISDEAEFTPKIIQTRDERVHLVYAVKITVPNNGALKIGMPGEVKFKK